MVTAIVKYDLFPHFNVIKGELLPCGGVKWNTNGTFKRESILAIYPEEQFERMYTELRNIGIAHRDAIKEMEKNLLNASTFKFLLTEGKIKKE